MHSIPEAKSGGTAFPSAAHSPHNPIIALQYVVVVLLLGVLYHSVILNLASQWWKDPNYSHGFLVILFCLWVIWKKRLEVAEYTPRPRSSGLLIVLLGLVTLVVGLLGADNFLSRSSFLIVVIGLAVYFRGWGLVRAFAFPLLCLFLAIPIPAIIFNQISLPLQLQASNLAARLLALINVPVFQEGNLIHLPTITLDVAEACSGIRSLVSLITLAILYGYFFERRVLIRLSLVIAAIPVAVIANGLRVAGTGVSGEYWGAEAASGFFHTFSALMIFICSTIMLFLIHKALILISHYSARNS